MKKTLLLTFGIMIVIVQPVFTQNTEYCFDTNRIFHVDNNNGPILSKIKHTCFEDGKENYSFNYVIFSTSEGNYIWKYGEYHNRYVLFTKDTLIISDFVNENYIYGGLSKSGKYDINKSILYNCIPNIQTNLYFLFYKQPNNIVFLNDKDTMINGVSHKVMYYKYLLGHYYDTKEPIYSYVALFLSGNKKKISKVTVKETGLEDYEDVYEIEHVGVGEDLKPQWAHTIFDKNSAIYSKFSFFDLDKKQIPASEMGKKSTDTMTEKLLHYPLVNSRGDTTSLNDFDGWVLLDFWIFGCRPCTEFHKRIQQEREKTGKILFKDMGIDILTIYILGGNTQTFRDYVSAYNIADISYAARDISLVINTPSFPRFFLVSPDKQIVYTTGDLSDYSELLKAKKEYEQKHPTNNKK